MKKEFSINKKYKKRRKGFIDQIQLQTMILIGLLCLIVFSYFPMYGIIIAFKDYRVGITGILDAPWVGFENFKEFLEDEMFWHALKNTLGINLLGLLIGFPAPILFALLLNELSNDMFKRVVQTISYLPHFISWVVYGGLVITILSPETGIVNFILLKLGIIKEAIMFMGEHRYFWWIAVFSGLLKELGWSAIIYLAAIAGIDPELYEAATIDGANRFQKMRYITVPCISGTIVLLLVLAVSGMLGSGFDQIWMLQNPLNVESSEVLDTYMYKIGIGQMRFSYATAFGLTRSVLAIILLLIANGIAKKITGKAFI
ncbi:ABC transporter permease [Caldicellulosiruptoraceae bacterium PP1]